MMHGKNAMEKAGQATQKPQASGLRLDSLGDLSSLLDEPTVGAGKSGPMELLLDLIDEDPDQPRGPSNPGFSPESIAEIGSTIKLRGVKSPISVRENMERPGRYLINHGARRYRGSKWANKRTIPGFIDNDYNHADQVIENLQRDGLTAREIADYIGRELSTGKKKGQIGEELGKSAAWITQYSTLLDLPDPIADAFNTGRASDVTVINELVKAYKKAPAEVSEWLADDGQELTRGSVNLLREFLDDKRKGGDGEGYGPNTTDNDEVGSGEQDPNKSGTKTEKKEVDPDKFKKAIIRVTHDERLARLIVNRRPPADGWAWLKYEADGQEFEANLTSVRLVAIVEA
jgi:ParB family transcriptional regulator, chromosome partitioning protein